LGSVSFIPTWAAGPFPEANHFRFNGFNKIEEKICLRKKKNLELPLLLYLPKLPSCIIIIIIITMLAMVFKKHSQISQPISPFTMHRLLSVKTKIPLSLPHSTSITRPPHDFST
jgi:MFS superfamily sulfate permease-like transporter